MQYSPARRTALVLCGTGAHGAYHAGVLRALHEAGVKIDVMAGRGVGAAAAMLAAVDGGARLWEPGGPWATQHTEFYGWTPRARWAAGSAAAGIALLVSWQVLVLVGALTPSLSSAGGRLLGGTIAALVLVTVVLSWRARPTARRAAGGWLSSPFAAPLDAAPICRAFSVALRQLLTGAAPAMQASPGATGRRYAEVVSAGLGQPGGREVMLVASDLDARGDLVAALLSEPYRVDFVAPCPGRERRAEIVDLAGAGRDHALDMMAGALTPAVACEPWRIRFATDGYWRGETHRLCDRPSSIVRLLEELSVAGVSQVVIASAVAPSGVPHRLRPTPRAVRGRLGEFVEASEAAALHDAMAMARLRFDAFYLIRPSHNPVGPFDRGGAYDEASDRRHATTELIEEGYEDAYHQFIEPVIGASGEQLAQRRGRAAEAAGHIHGQGLFDDAHPQR